MAAKERPGTGDDGGVTVDTPVRTKTKKEEKLAKPPLYLVLMHNDHYTTREFVVEVLKGVFHKSETEATTIMLHVHNNGMGVAGVFPFDIAETKVRTVEALARKQEFPLRLTLEPED